MSDKPPEMEVLNKVAEMSAEIVMTKSSGQIADAVIKTIKTDKELLAAINADQKDNKSEELKEAANQFQKLAKGEVKSLTVGGTGAGAELVPTTIREEIITTADLSGLVRQKAQKWPMTGPKESAPVMGSVTAYRVSEGAKVGSSKPTTAGAPLTSKIVGVIVPVSKMLLYGASPAFVTALTRLMAKGMARLEDRWGILGLGAGEGILQNASIPVLTMASGKTTYASAVCDNFLDLQTTANEENITDRSEFLSSLSVKNVLRKERALISTDKQEYIFGAPGLNTPPTLWDQPYTISPVMPKTSAGSQAGTKFAALFNWDNMVYGDLGKYEFSILDQATITDDDGSTLINLAEQEMVGLKMTAYIDITIADPANAGAVLKTALS